VVLYVNGVQVASGSGGGSGTTQSDAAQSFNVGGDPSGSTSFNGKIDQVRAFNYIRTRAQLNWDMNRGAPIAHWKLDDCESTVINDSSGNSYTGTLTVGASGTYTSAGTCSTSSASSTWYNGATGKRNYSIALDGTDDFITITGLLGLNANSTNTNVSVSAWANLTTADSAGAEIVSIGDYVNIRAEDNGAGCAVTGVTAAFQRTAGDWLGLCSDKPIAGTGWHHITFTVDDTNNVQKLYIDGILYDTGTEANSILWTGQGSNTFIGKHGNGSTTQDFGGKIDDVKVYKYALTAAQVKTIYNEGVARYGPTTGAP
jgi:hypothetical protein